MSEPFNLFEVSWEVCNKVGGIHTVVSTKARTMIERLGHEHYMAVGPWLLSESDDLPQFEDDPDFAGFVEECRALGAPIRLGHWRIPGSPRTMLVSFSEQYPHRDEILTELWLRFGVDSLGSQWDYIEPVLFGHAAALALRHWWRTFRRGLDSRGVVQCHEWLTGSALLGLTESEPSLGTVFTTHATVLGRAASGSGRPLGPEAPLALADTLHVKSKHSLESVTAAEADVFTTVSRITAEEAALVLGRAPDPILPNGVDLAVFDALVGDLDRGESRHRVRMLAQRFLGRPVDDAAILAISGRYEFRNKGIDLLLDALGQLNLRKGRSVVLLVLVPAANSGLCKPLLERLAGNGETGGDPVGLSTHNLFDPGNDPIQRRCSELGLDNAPDSRVKIIHVPIYLRPGDGLFDLNYEAVLQGMDLTCFPSRYEPWGYTPQESLAAGVPTITSDLAGFGRWCLDNGLTAADGVDVLERAGVPDGSAAQALAELLEKRIQSPCDSETCLSACRRTASRVEWTDLIGSYEQAFAMALDHAAARLREQPPGFAPTISVPARPDGDGDGPRLFPVTVRARLPRQLATLSRLAKNYWWATDAEANRLFERIDPELWRRLRHSPLAVIRSVSPARLQALADDPAFVAELDAIVARLEAFLSEPGAAETDGASTAAHPIAYLSAEFGLHESLPIYSGGLGILAGDHLKSASDLRLPVVAVGLFYHRGYFEQRMTAAGEQLALDVPLDPHDLPLEPVVDPQGDPLRISLALPGGSLTLAAWRAMVGRVPLYLLDADLPDNLPEMRAITRNLYSADPEVRLRQEIVLGKGGVRLLRCLGIRPSAYHLNEGHAALAGLERIADLVGSEGLTFDEALALVRATTVFTTHTPVAAGHDRFPVDLVRRYFSDVATWLGVPWERFFELGQKPGDPDHFNMTGLAIRVSGSINAVSRLHGRVSQELLAPFWPHELLEDVPIATVTNGVHLPSWTSAEMAALVGSHRRPVRGEDFEFAAADIEDRALWAARGEARRRLLDGTADRLTRSFVDRHDSPRLLSEMIDGLVPEALLIGAARRFAPYKRADLLMRDVDRLAALLGNPARPVRLFLAGKAHPRDDLGQAILRQVANLSRDPRLVGKLILLEDYDIDLARLLVQGCDAWLNTPRHLLEASGTSGMKAAANGGLNVSVLDGWWPEAYDGANGWTIGGDRVYEDPDLQDELDATLLFDLLEEEVAPLFFERDHEGLPRRWLSRVRRGLVTIPPRFDTARMVGEYWRRFYVPMALRRQSLEADRHATLRELTLRRDRLSKLFPRIRILDARVADLERARAGDSVATRIVLSLGELSPADVAVELVIGRPAGRNRLEGVSVTRLSPKGPEPPDGHVFQADHVLDSAGALAYGIRIRATDADAGDLVQWA